MAKARKAPWHLWVVGILTLIWNGFGAFDYIMTQTENVAYMEAFTDAQLEYYYSMPVWYVACWAIAIWTSVLASLCLLLRLKLAVLSIVISMIGFLVTALYSIVLHPMPDAEPAQNIFSLVIFLILLFQLIYTFVMSRVGVLR